MKSTERGSSHRRRGRAVCWVVGVSYLVWVVGQVARDACWVTGLAFYLPSPVLAAVLLGFVAWGVLTCRRHVALIGVVALFPPVWVVGAVENNFHAHQPPTQTGLKLMHWNTGGRPTRAGIEDYLVAEHADVYVLSEMPNAEHVGFFRRRLGYGFFDVTFDNLAVVARGRVRAEGWLINDDGVRAQLVTWEADGHPLRLIVVDLPSDLRVARNPKLRAVTKLIEGTHPDLVVGDFNAPRRSRALTELPADYRHAYHSCGDGWGSTWPLPLPLYSLDHVIHGPGILPLAYRLGGRGADSDHCYQIFYFAVNPW